MTPTERIARLSEELYRSKVRRMTAKQLERHERMMIRRLLRDGEVIARIGRITEESNARCP